MSELAIIILNWNGTQDTIECLKSITKNEGYRYNIYLLDNNSKVESVNSLEKWIKENWNEKYSILDHKEFVNLNDYGNFQLSLIKNNKNLGFAKGNNFVLKNIKDQFNYFLLLNNDTVISKESIRKMFNYIKKNKKIKVLSCDIRLYSNPEKLWNAGGYFTWYGDRKYYSQTKVDHLIDKGTISIETPFVTGCAMMVNKDILSSNGLFTEKFFFGEEDFNLCKSLYNNDIKIETLLTTRIYHKVGQSRQKNKDKNIGLFRSNLLHYTNRIIDNKNFYPSIYWLIWRIIYIIAVSFNFFLKTTDVKLTFNLLFKLFLYTKNYDEIDYEIFKKIFNIKSDEN